MTTGEILLKLDEIQCLLKTNCLNGKTTLAVLAEAIGNMSEARTHVENIIKHLSNEQRTRS